MVLATMTNVGIVPSSRSVPLPRTNRLVLSLETISAPVSSDYVGETYVARHEFAYTKPKIG